MRERESFKYESVQLIIMVKIEMNYLMILLLLKDVLSLSHVL
jgi:hypothetical protein